MFELQTTTATDAKTNFWLWMDKAKKHPVLIKKNNKEHSVLLSIDDFEDLLLSLKSYEAMEGGFIWVQESEKFLKELLVC